MKNGSLKNYLGCAAVIMAVAGCIYYPEQAKNTAAPSKLEPVNILNKWQLFEDKADPLRLQVVSAAASDESAVAKYLEKAIHDVDVMPLQPNEVADVKVFLRSKFTEISPAPKCRMYQDINITVSTPDGIRLLDPWKFRAESSRNFKSAEDARATLISQANKGIDHWAQDVFMNGSSKRLEIAVLRFKLSTFLIELDPFKFEHELRVLLNEIRKIKGVCSLRMISSDPNSRTVEFRVLYRKDIQPRGLVKAISKIEQ